MKKTDARPAPSVADVSGIIAMAWQDDTPFEAIALQFGLSEVEVIALMRENLKARSFRIWRMRVRGRSGKHQARQAAQQLHTQGHAQPQAWPAMGDCTLSEGQEELPLPPSTVTRQSLR